MRTRLYIRETLKSTAELQQVMLLKAKRALKKKSDFYKDMCQAMVAINMPWRCVNNEVWRNFLSKYTNQAIPDESTLRKNYLQECYESTLQNIRNDIGDNYVWISVDETTDSTGRYIANLIIGKLCEDEITKPYLIGCKQLEATNHATIARFVNSSIQRLWPSGAEDRILLLITDAAVYMLKAGQNLKIFFPSMLHVTCLVHGLNRVTEEVRLQFPTVNKLISCIKKVFLKAPLRVERYRSKLGNTPLPPEPVLTRWGTWIEAALFYGTHLNSIKEIIESFDENEASSIKSAKEVLQHQHLRQNLTFIQSHFQILPETMKKLEAVGLPLTEAINVVTAVAETLRNVPGECGQKVVQKFEGVLERNPDFDKISKINDILKGSSVEGPEEVPAQHWCKFKYAPITSCDVERSFSAYKLILTDKRHQFTVENLEKTLVIYCYLNYNK